MTVRLVGLAALCLSTVACFSGFKTSDIKCQKDSQCPKGQSCSIPSGGDYGSCVSGPSASGGTGGGKASSSLRSSSIATGGKANDTGLGSRGGTGGGTATVIGGAGGVSVTHDGGASISSGGTAGGVVSTGSEVGGSANGGAVDGGVTSLGGTTVVSGGSGGTSSATTALFDNGAICQAGSECVSNLCIEGVCCDGKCDGQCESCKQAGSVGTCKALQGNPISGKTACAGTGACKGQCDGTNGKTCAFPGTSVICTAASCKDGKATAASLCDGQGSCTTPATNSCPSNVCSSDGSKCSDSCAGGNCGADMYCSGTGVCLPKKKAGEKCTSKDECATELCADGVCCATACSGQCQACNESGKVGTCTRITGAPRGTRTPCTSKVATCGGSCDGSSDTKCAYPGSEKVCTAAKCSTDLTSATSASVCDEAGACTAAQSINCGASANYCASGACTAKLPPGGSCTNNVQCASGNCSNGTCCGAGLTLCGGSCVDLQTSNTHCGACSHSCGSQECMSGLCCDANSVKCGNACCGPNHKCSNNVCSCTGTTLSCGQCGSWGFDSGTSSTEGWFDPSPESSHITSLTINSKHVFEGKYSLAVGFNDYARVEIKPCPSGIPLAGYTFSAQVSLVGAGIPAEGCYVALVFTSYPGFQNAPTYGDSWTTLSYPFTDLETNLESYLGVSADCPGFSGTMYIDSVTLTK